MAISPDAPAPSKHGATPAERSKTPAMVFDFEDALSEVLRHAVELRSSGGDAASEEVALLASAGRILAEAILADRDQPPFDRSTRDGFAVRAADFTSGMGLRIVGQVRAGDSWTGEPLGSGDAIEIMTGAPLPAGADAIAMVEHVVLAPSETGASGIVRASAGRVLRVGDNVVPQGSEARAGVEVVAAGTMISAAEIALAATAGQSTIAVYTRPSVAIVATGDELVEVDQKPNARQIRNSNSYALAALVTAAGANARRLPIARDLREDLLACVAEARQSDLILFSGGVSMGKFDLVEEVLAGLGAEFFFTGVRMQPGKPVVFGRLPERDGEPARYFFGLPGNPISTQVTFHCFVEPFLRTLIGEHAAGSKFVLATLTQDVAGKQGLMRLLPALLTSSIRGTSVCLVGWQGSGDLAANARANCYAVFSPETEMFRAGDVIPVLLR